MRDVESLEEKAKYEKVWQDDRYRLYSPGDQIAETFLNFFQNEIKPADSLTDFGSGTGMSTLKFLEKGLHCQLVDIATNALDEKIEALTLLLPQSVTFTQASLWDLPISLKPTDWIYCIDVLEHIPTDKIDQVLKGMSQRTKKGGIFQICLQQDRFGPLSIEKNLHLTVKPTPWWIDKITTYWDIEAVLPSSEKLFTLFYLGSPKSRLDSHG